MAKNLSAQRNKNKSRPRKGAAGKRQRLKTQKARLVKLGVPAEQAEKLNSKEVRSLLRRPGIIRKTTAG